MIILIDLEKAFVKVQYPIVIKKEKPLSKVEIQINLIKCVFKTSYL